MLYTRIMMAGQVIDHLIGPEGVTGKDDVFIFFFGKGKIRVNVFIGIREAFIPGTDHLLLSGEHVDGFHVSEGIIGLSVYEIDISGVESISDIVIKGVGIKESWSRTGLLQGSSTVQYRQQWSIHLRKEERH